MPNDKKFEVPNVSDISIELGIDNRSVVRRGRKGLKSPFKCQ